MLHIRKIRCYVAALLAVLVNTESDLPESSSVSLLQHSQTLNVVRGPRRDALDPASQAARLQAALPLQWQHIPKCGSSLANFLIQLPDVCPGIPEDLVISQDTFGPMQLATFDRLWNVTQVSGPCSGNLGKFGNDKTGIGMDWDTRYKGHAVVMLRQPEQRILSGYHYGYHSWPSERGPPADEVEYAKVTRGCMVSMLTRESEEESCVDHFVDTPTEQEVQMAIDRVRNGFTFVGLTEQWALSMCLGHRILGGRCRLSDFIDNRVTMRNATGYLVERKVEVRARAPEYDVTPLRGYRDPVDGPLYEAAKEVFARDSRRYGVSFESCQPCFREAGISVEM